MPNMVEVTCKWKGCGRRFEARVADRKRGWGKFCSKRCKAAEQEHRTGQYKAHKRRESREPWDDEAIGHPFESGLLGHGQE